MKIKIRNFVPSLKRSNSSDLTNANFDGRLLMQLLVKGRGSPFINEEVKYPSAELNPSQSKTNSKFL